MKMCLSQTTYGSRNSYSQHKVYSVSGYNHVPPR